MFLIKASLRTFGIGTNPGGGIFVEVAYTPEECSALGVTFPSARKVDASLVSGGRTPIGLGRDSEWSDLEQTLGRSPTAWAEEEIKKRRLLVGWRLAGENWYIWTPGDSYKYYQHHPQVLRLKALEKKGTIVPVFHWQPWSSETREWSPGFPGGETIKRMDIMERIGLTNQYVPANSSAGLI